MRRVTMKMIAVAAVALGSGKAAMASWLSWFGVACTVGGIVTTIYGGPGGIILGGGLGIVEIICVAVDVVDEFTYNPNGPDDPVAVAFSEETYQQLLTASFPHVEIGASTHPEVNSAINAYIDSANTYIAHTNQGADLLVIANDRASMAAHIYNIRAALEDAGLASMPLTAEQMSEAQEAIAENGIPQWEIDYLQSAGLGPEYVEAFTNSHSLVDTTVLGTTDAASLFNLAADVQLERAVELAFIATPAPSLTTGTANTSLPEEPAP